MFLRGVLLLTLAAVCCHGQDTRADCLISRYYHFLKCSNVTDVTLVTARLTTAVIAHLVLDNSTGLVLKREDFNDPAYKTIERFDFINSNLTSFTSEPLLGLEKLNYLFLENNQLTTINEQSFTGLTALEGLFLKRNQIETISDGVFKGIDNLRGIDLSSNKLTSIRHEIFNGLQNLKILNLAKNSLTTIDGTSFSGLEKLELLALSDNNITTINPLAFHNNSKLDLLDLGNNNLDSLDSQIFASNHKLRALNLNGNDFQNLSNFQLVSSVRRLYLASCNIHTIPDGYLSQLSNLEELNLANNKISEISSNLLPPSSTVKAVYLDNNELTSLNVASYAQFQRIIVRMNKDEGYHVSWKNNPWNCTTSEMIGLREHVGTHHSNFDDLFQCNAAA